MQRVHAPPSRPALARQGSASSSVRGTAVSLPRLKASVPSVMAYGRRRQGAVVFAAATRPSTRTPSPQQILKLVQDIVEISLQTGPRGIVRGLQGVEAVTTVAQEILASQRPGAPPPSAPAILRRLFEQLGSTYVKLGQFIASSPTIFPEEYVVEFQKCLDKTPAIPFSTIKEVVEAELGKPLSSVFEYVETTPLASASIAQVHCAVLKDSRKEVVLKVLKPAVVDQLTVDLNFLLVVSRVLEFITPELSRTSLANIVADVRASMLDEVDFTKEAQNMAAFNAYLSASGIAEAVVPFVYPALSSRRLLVMERLRGVPLTDLEAIRKFSRGDPEATLISALNTWFGSVLACESFHADVHAGNLLVLSDGRVGFIDFGIVGRISPGTWGAMQALVTSASTNDYRLMAKALIQMGATAPVEEVNELAFARDLEKLYGSINSIEPNVVMTQTGAGDTVAASVSVNEQDINRLVLDVVRVGETYGLKFPREFGLLLKQLLYFDRYLRLLAPELQVFSDDRVNFRTIGGGANGGMGGGGVGGAGMGGGGGTGSWGATSAAAYSNRR